MPSTRAVATAVIALLPSVVLVAPGCTDGTTPDCSAPDSGCAPDLTPHLPEASPDTGADATDAATDRGDTGGDARDAPGDAVDERDADAARDATPG